LQVSRVKHRLRRSFAAAPLPGRIDFPMLMRLACALIPTPFPVRPATGHTYACGGDFRAPRQMAIKG
jgi:hypothetical protein